jgi:Tfp pilus assembly protein PilX
MSKRLQRLLHEEDGFAMSLVVVLSIALTVFSVALIDIVSHETGRSSHAVTRDASFHAAEAGINDYLTKLLSDRVYYTHEVHPGEATRLAGAVTASAGQAWTGGLAWSYPNGKNAWRALSNGYEYDLQVTPPSAASSALRIVSTGRPAGSTDASDWRVLETLVRQSSVTDFQMLANADISYGSTATTYGKIYAGIDSNGVAHSVTHAGTAYADVYAEGSVLGSPTLRNGAKTYGSATIRTVVKSPINFNDFLASLVDIQRASQTGGVFLNNTAVDGWKLTFSSTGTFTAQTCMKASARDIAQTSPTCGAASTYNVPANGAIYVGQSAIVSGVVNGRVTVASNNNIVIGGNLSYQTTGDDVLGLVAATDMIVAQWTPSTLTWRAATIAQSGAWRSWSNDSSHVSMTFQGSTSTNLGGSMGMFQTRVYQYDDSLLYLQPPWFPTVDGAFTILLSRELAASAS